MGDPRKIKKKFSTPSHPWQKARIDDEKRLNKIYRFKNKKEIWKMNSTLKGFQTQAKRLAAARGSQAEREEKQLLDRLVRLGMLTAENRNLDSVLDLQVENVMDRRLQSVVAKLGLSNTTKQARQFITHRHIMIDGQVITSPSYLVSVAEESKIGFVGKSALANDMHPERLSKEQRKEMEAQKLAAKAAAEAKAAEEKAEAPAEGGEAPAEAPAEEKPAEAPAEEAQA